MRSNFVASVGLAILVATTLQPTSVTAAPAIDKQLQSHYILPGATALCRDFNRVCGSVCKSQTAKDLCKESTKTSHRGKKTSYKFAFDFDCTCKNGQDMTFKVLQTIASSTITNPSPHPYYINFDDATGGGPMRDNYLSFTTLAPGGSTVAIYANNNPALVVLNVQSTTQHGVLRGYIMHLLSGKCLKAQAPTTPVAASQGLFDGGSVVLAPCNPKDVSQNSWFALPPQSPLFDASNLAIEISGVAYEFRTPQLNQPLVLGVGTNAQFVPQLRFT